MILLLHPLAQLAAIVLAFYAGFLGWQRARSLHLHETVRFRRNLHALLGSVALVSLMAGIIGGIIIFSHAHRSLPLESLHGRSGLFLLPFLLFGIFSGHYLYAYPPKGKVLSVLHGVNNLIVLLLALFQVYSGSHLYLHLLDQPEEADVRIIIDSPAVSDRVHSHQTHDYPLPPGHSVPPSLTRDGLGGSFARAVTAALPAERRPSALPGRRLPYLPS